MIHFIWGAFMMGCCMAGLFFLRFWRETRDRFFVIFSFAFWMMALERAILLYLKTNNEIGTYVYFVRLVAFVFIVWAIFDKNRSKRNEVDGEGYLK